eukprot:GHVS01095622.1.p1 GENE.GHVS01095622.1~~GHVS01095622.1.p1  ORF type:complete len:754 (+),score=74.66 GHVS01095622.1:145-2406(+)
MAMRLAVQKLPTGRSELSATNYGYVSPATMRVLTPQVPSNVHNVTTGTVLCEIKELILNIKADGEVPDGQLMLNNLHRECRKIATKDEVVLRVFTPPKHHFVAGIVSYDVTTYVAQLNRLAVKDEDISPVFKKYFCGQACTVGQMLAVHWGPSQALKFTVKKIIPLDSVDTNEPSEKHVTYGLITQSTQHIFAGADDGKVQINSKTGQKSIFKAEMTFENLNVGGLDKELQFIYRRAFVSRMFPPHIIAEMGMNHVRGMLLHGPPGTGKTLIAREISKALNTVAPKIVCGPEVLNKYVGQSEENIRKLFAEAEADQLKFGDDSPLHTIIFDEIDAICKQRSASTSNAGVNDNIVTQLLSKIDGVDALTNVLLIGMTNRRDLIDDAMLRPGRLEVLVEIGLPDEKGRMQILNIHTKGISQSKRLANDVSLAELAANTKNFTGAEIEGLVRTAITCALNSKLQKSGIGKAATADSSLEGILVDRSHFETALEEVVPQFGAADSGFDDAMENGIISFGDTFDSVLEHLQTRTKAAAGNFSNRAVSTVLLHGQRGTGKTALAAHVAKTADFPFMKMVSPESLSSHVGEMDRAQAMREVFENAYKSELSLIVLDDLETLVGYNPIGTRFSTLLLETIRVLLKKKPKPGRRVVIIGTTSEIGFVSESKLAEEFGYPLQMPLLEEPSQIETVLKARHDKFGDFPHEEIAQVIRDHNLLRPIGIKHLLSATLWAAEECHPNHITYKAFQQEYHTVASTLRP